MPLINIIVIIVINKLESGAPNLKGSVNERITNDLNHVEIKQLLTRFTSVIHKLNT